MIDLLPNSKLLVNHDGMPYDRLGGWENELSYSSRPRLAVGQVNFPDEFMGEDGALNYYGLGRLFWLACGRADCFDADGFRRYIDVGEHPESSTPEHLNYLQLAHSSLYGIVKMSQLLGGVVDEFKERGLNLGVVLSTNTSDPAGNIWATHHNLIARRSLEVPDYKDALIAHYVSRIVWAGSGAPIQNKDGIYKFGLSTRADHIWDDVSKETMRNRPFINTRDEAHADHRILRRLHGIHGEMVYSPQVLAAVMATESIILRACELGVKFDDLVPIDPYKAIRDVSHDPTLKQTILIKGEQEENPRSITAIQLQRELLNRALDAAEAANYITPQERRYGAIVNHYLDLLEDVDGNRAECAKLFDWVRKEEILDRYISRPRQSAMSDYQVAWAAMTAFHRTYPKEGIGLQLLREGSYIDAPLATVLDHGPGLPPTRALARAAAIRVLREAGLEVSGDWMNIIVDKKVKGSDRSVPIGAVSLPNPYALQSQELDKLVRQGLMRAA